MSGPGWNGDDETRRLGEPPGQGSSGTRKPKLQVFTGMATTLKPKPGEAWQGDAETRPRSGSTTAADPAAQPTPLPSTGATGRTTRITALLSADGRRGPLSGAAWPDYELGDLLGQGGMGAVYRARQISVDRLVALKVLPAHLANDADLRRRFEIEARASSTLASPHIVQVHHAGVHDGQLFFAMEFVAGQSLSELIKARRTTGTGFALAESLGYVAQLAEALRVAGAAGVVHRDIKPANCMLDAQGQLKLADFGIAKILGEDGGTLTGTAMGTPSYLSPEQARGEEIDQRADLYSLGIMLYELATGRLPFTGGTPDVLVYQHAFTEPPLPRSLNKDISADLQAVILKLIQKDPAARYPDATALLTDLGRITGGMAPEVAIFVGRKLGTGADAALARIGGWRRRAWIAAAAVIASTTALGGGWWYWDARKSEIAGLRTELAKLDQPVPVPVGADKALERLANLSGPEDPYVVRWRDDLARTTSLEAELTRLKDAERPDLQAAELALTAYEKEIGNDNPVAKYWQDRLAAMKKDVATLRRELAELDQVDTAPAAREAALTPLLERYVRLAPPDDRDAQRWGAALARSRDTIAGLRTGLAALDKAPVAPAALPALDTDLARLRTLAGAEDADGRRWQDRLTEAHARIEAWRKSLGRLDDAALPDAETLAVTAVDLAAWAAVAGEDDPELRRWRGAIAAAAARRQQLATGLAAVGDGLIAADRLDALARDITEYRRLAGLDDADGRRWSAVVAAARDRIGKWKAQLAGLDARSETLSREDQRLAQGAIDGLRSCAALDPEVETRWRARLASDDARLAVLASGLAALDQVGSPPAAADGWLSEYERLVGADDKRAVQWRARLNAIAALRGRLAGLDSAQPLPDGAGKDLDELAKLVGAGDSQVATWRGKLERCAFLARELAALDRAQPPSAEAGARLDAYQREVGPEAPDLRRWRSRLERIAVLRTRLDGLGQRLLPDPGAAKACSELAGLIGREATAAARQRLAEIAGPPRPSWAVEAGDDVYGRWIAADLGGPRLRLRWIPCGTVLLGSPAGESGGDDDEVPAMVTLTRGFWCAERECSQGEWRAIMTTSPALQRGDTLPVERVSWDMAQAFCLALSQRLGVTARLPGEAEWEHAARAGTAATWIGPQGALDAGSLDRVAVFAAAAPAAGGQRLPNPLGLFDLQGNVWEWCQDGYAAYPVRPATDHLGSGPLKVIRGGSWGDDPQQLRLANRQRIDPAMRSPYLGFRVVVEGGKVAEVNATTVYRVQAGDTLTRIAERLLGSRERWRELVAWNPGIDIGMQLKVGQELFVKADLQ